MSLKTPLVKYRKGQEECPLTLNIPDGQRHHGRRFPTTTWPLRLRPRAALASFTATQTIEDEAAMVARVKNYKAGFVESATPNLSLPT